MVTTVLVMMTILMMMMMMVVMMVMVMMMVMVTAMSDLGHNQEKSFLISLRVSLVFAFI